MPAIPNKTLHFFAVLCIALACSAKPTASAESDPPVRVVVSFSILADWLSEVGGNRVQVVSLVAPDADAHVFRPTPAHLRAVAAAQLIFINGLGFEGWLQRLLTAMDTHAPVVTLSTGITAIERKPSAFSRTTTSDPHAWHSVPNATVYVSNIAAALCAIDAGGCEQYSLRARAYIARLVDLHAELRKRFASVPLNRRKVILSHDAFGYLAREYGVEFIAVQGTSTDTEAAAGHLAALITWARQHQAPMFLENVTDPRLLQQIGRETGHDPSAKLYSDALSTPDGPAGTYIELMRFNTNALVSAMLAE